VDGRRALPREPAADSTGGRKQRERTGSHLTASCRGRGSTDLWHGGSATQQARPHDAARIGLAEAWRSRVSDQGAESAEQLTDARLMSPTLGKGKTRPSRSNASFTARLRMCSWRHFLYSSRSRLWCSTTSGRHPDRWPAANLKGAIASCERLANAREQRSMRRWTGSTGRSQGRSRSKGKMPRRRKRSNCCGACGASACAQVCLTTERPL
jgi:hypothetical protein